MITLFLPDNVPICVNLPKDIQNANIYFISDLHYGDNGFNEDKWKLLIQKIDSEKNSYICWLGDLMQNAIPNSKSSVFEQNKTPTEQKEYITELFTKYKDKTLAVVSGNHCNNRSTKVAGLYPLYDCCLLAGIGDKYRDTIAFLDIGIGRHYKNPKTMQVHYYGQIQHNAKDLKTYCSADYTDGIDFLAYGHNHHPKDDPRAKYIFDKQRKSIYKQSIEVINTGSFCGEFNYATKNGARPQSDKLYVLTLFSGKKQMQTTGFYV